MLSDAEAERFVMLWTLSESIEVVAAGWMTTVEEVNNIAAELRAAGVELKTFDVRKSEPISVYGAKPSTS